MTREEVVVNEAEKVIEYYRSNWHVIAIPSELRVLLSDLRMAVCCDEIDTNRHAASKGSGVHQEEDMG